MIELSYAPDGRELERYLVSQARVALIQGPRGSGKSTASCYKLWMNALNQPVANDKAPSRKRYRRTYAVRNTFDELNRTTIKTWLMATPESRFGPLKRSNPPTHHIQLEDLDWEVIFLAMDREDDVKKLLSTEASDVWLNEFRELPRRVVDDVDPILRYPPRAWGGVALPQVIGDTNAPQESHWFAIMSGQVPMPEDLSEDDRAKFTKPETWEFFRQPGAMFETVDADGLVAGYQLNPNAENLRWLPDGYYQNMIAGKSKNWIRVNVLNRPGRDQSGKPVWPMFRDDETPAPGQITHVAKAELQPEPGHTIHVGIDFGRRPAAVFGQRIFDRWRILGELVADEKGLGVRAFARKLKGELSDRFPNFNFSIFGDPTGDNFEASDDITPFMMCQAEGLQVYGAPSNDPSIRIEAVAELLLGTTDGKPRMLLSTRVPKLKAAMAGDYQYRKMALSGDHYSEKPDKNHASNVADALQYCVLGAGEGRAVLGRSTQPLSPVIAPRAMNVLARRSIGGRPTVFDRRR